MNYCCDVMEKEVKNGRLSWDCSGGKGRAVFNDQILLLNYCPFCGKKYPVEAKE